MIRQYLAALGCLLLGVATTPAAGQSATPALQRGEVRLTYLGNAGWEITDGRTVVLVDPFLTQFARWPAPGQPAARVVGMDSLYLPDSTRIDRHIQRADYILVTHGHSDHALDAPYIARKTGAAIIGTETIANLARAAGVQEQFYAVSVERKITHPGVLAIRQQSQ